MICIRSESRSARHSRASIHEPSSMPQYLKIVHLSFPIFLWFMTIAHKLTGSDYSYSSVIPPEAFRADKKQRLAVRSLRQPSICTFSPTSFGKGNKSPRISTSRDLWACRSRPAVKRWQSSHLQQRTQGCMTVTQIGQRKSLGSPPSRARKAGVTINN